ncbi:unnamed protein product [Heligmosomoides polygyrus]|uniref:Transthyretin-like family protein n=1 Tax=Heligmosomoides polygyrus TaxID=6339 RepID=A0A183G8M0_HELPZ|nr:unnamed protein product [Heligmosomoides polygyrus]
MRHLFLVLLFFSCTAVVLGLFGIGRRQSISVQGHLTCNGRPVKLYDKGVDFQPCYKKLSITIPKKFITLGRTPNHTYNIGSINLASRFKGETIDCIN